MGCLLKQGGGLYPRVRIGVVVLAALPHLDLLAQGADVASLARILPDLLATLH